MEIKKQKVGNFLQDLGSRRPVPGGGSVSALVGAIGSALVKKICLLTLGKEKYKGVEKKMKRLSRKATELENDLIELVEEDEKAYMAMITFRKHQIQKGKNYQEIVKRTIEVPLEIAKKSLIVLKIAVYVSESGNQNLRADAFCAIELATAAIYGSLETVRANFVLVKNQKYLDELKNKIEKILNGVNNFVRL